MKFSQIIYLKKDDDIGVAIDKINQANTPEVVLVVPRDAEILSSIVNLKLLKREADILSKHLVFSTDDKAGRHLIQRAGIELGKEEKIEKLREEVIPSRASTEPPARESAVGRIESPRRMMADIVVSRKPEQRLRQEERLPEERIEMEEPEEIIGEREIIEPIESPTQEFYPQERRSEEPIIGRESLVENFWEQTRHQPVPVPEYQNAYSEQDARYIGRTARYSERNAHASSAHYEPLAPSAKELDVFVADRKEKKKRFIALPRFKKLAPVFIVAGIAVFFVAAYFILPRAKITITPKAEASNYELSVIADKNINKIDYSLKKIPAQLVKIEKKENKEFEATGSSSGSQKAKGIISVYNNYSSAPQTLVATTRFVAKNSGKLFRLTKTIIVPGAKTEAGKLVASSIEAEVTADQPGVDYNIGPSEFTIPGFQGTPKYSGFYGKSNGSMAGGSSSAGAKIVSAEDLEKAKKTLEEELKIDAAQSLKGQISSNFKLLDKAMKEEEPEVVFSHSAGAAAEKFTGTISAQIIALVFDPKYIGDLAGASASQNARQIEVADSNVNYDSWKVDFEKGQISMDLKIDAEGIGMINTAELKNKLAGKNEADIRKILSQTASVQNAKITLWPFWVKEIPKQTNKIEIIIE